MSKIEKKYFREIETIDFMSISQSMIKATAINSDIAEFRIQHTIRVAATAVALSLGAEINTFKLIIACQLHDSFKYIAQKEEHGLLAAKYLKRIVQESVENEEERKEWLKVCAAIKNHSSGNKKYGNLYTTFLYEADKLDHISVGYLTSFQRLFGEGESMPEILLSNAKKVIRCNGCSKNFNNVFETLLAKAVMLVENEEERTKLLADIRAYAEEIAKEKEAAQQEEVTSPLSEEA